MEQLNSVYVYVSSAYAWLICLLLIFLGTIPPAIYSLTSLKSLFLENDSFDGKLTKYIDVDSVCSVTSSTVWMSVPTVCTCLLLLFVGPIAPEIGMLSSIEQIVFYGNSFTGAVPNSLCTASQLTMLHVGPNTGLVCYPACLSSVTDIQFTGIPSGCPSDQENGMCGLVAATNIATVSAGGSVWGCDSGGYPTSDVCGWLGVYCDNGGVGPNVEKIDLTTNGLTGTVPASIGSLSTLTTLILSNNGLHGPLPSSIGFLSALVNLRLGGNLLTGSLPSTIGCMTKLATISIASNKLSGPLPDTLGSLVLLTFFSVSTNSIDGQLPNSIGGCSSLQILYALSNSLTGMFVTVFLM